MQERFKVGQAVYQDVLGGGQAQQAGEVCDQREGHIWVTTGWMLYHHWVNLSRITTCTGEPQQRQSLATRAGCL